MKKQNLLALFFIIFLFTEAQAQESCCGTVDYKETAEIAKELKPNSQEKIKAILDQEIKLFTNYISQNFEYPELAEYKMVEGKMIVHIIYDNGFDSIKLQNLLTLE